MQRREVNPMTETILVTWWLFIIAIAAVSAARRRWVG